MMRIIGFIRMYVLLVGKKTLDLFIYAHKYYSNRSGNARTNMCVLNTMNDNFVIIIIMSSIVLDII